LGWLLMVELDDENGVDESRCSYTQSAHSV
jgi:hypothetical protein